LKKLIYGSVNLLKYKLVVFSLVLLSYLISLQFPLSSDEALYTISIKDNIKIGLQPTATYFGESMYWKPSFMFNIYAILGAPFYGFIEEGLLFKTISLFFLLLSLFILFQFFKYEFNNEEKAYWGIILLLITPAFFIFSIKILTDTLMFLFVCGALFLTQRINENKWNKILLMLCFIGVGLTKSMIFVLLMITICLIYYYSKNKKISKEIIIIGFFAIILLILHTYILGIESLNSGDFGRLNKIEWNNININIIKILTYMGLLPLALFKPKKELISLYLIIIFCIIYLLFYDSLLPWYLYIIFPIFILFIIDVKKELIISLIPLNILLIIVLLMLSHYGNFCFYPIILDEQFNETIYIGRLGEVIANKIYNYNGVMVTPVNSFTNEGGEWYGWPEKMTKENLLGLIYDYENPNLWPKYVEELTSEEKYLPPIAKTYKNFDGQFNQIIIEEQYFLKIEEEILDDYYIYKIIDEIYILKRNE
jgi:4-amino-4-deoxy-L-arabinose transferase-like glycosyltransferase